MLRASTLLAAGILVFSGSPGRAFEAPPAPTRWATDNAGLLSAATRTALDARIDAHERQTGRQVLVWIDRTTGDVPIEDFAVRTFEKWGVGRKGIDEGLVLFIFTEDRRARIEVGYGLEDRVPDAVASRVIRETLIPKLQAGDADGAVSSAIAALLTAIGGEAGAAALPQRRAAPREAPRPSLGQIILFGLLGIGFLVLLVTHPSLALYLLFSVLSGGRGGGFSGGGFSGGGGRSGGGGASGSW
jgi:uncharacterized protein